MYLKFKEVSFKECLIIVKNICFLLRFQGRPLLKRFQGGFVKLNFMVAFQNTQK